MPARLARARSARRFGGVAGSLSAIARRQPEIRRERRNFRSPGTAFSDFEITRRWTIEEYGREIAPRIRALAASEEPPYVMPWVAEPWGVALSDLADGGTGWVEAAG